VPKKYIVVSNGKLISKTGKELTNTYYFKTKKEIPTKVMVIGVADFLTQTVQKVPYEISSFVYPKDKFTALVDYAIAPQITSYFESTIGRYPFDKLYNVQSTTKYGGMENAGCIFYDENNVDGKNTNENLLAHEIAHQWFGNSVTEENWKHLWLSEGFATYLENMYMEQKYGKDSLISIMKHERLLVLKYKESHPNKVLVPKKVEDPNTMLNPYTYQKGAWVLHMVRNEIGDDQFIKLLKDFYNKYKYKNASTDDFVNLIHSKYSERVKVLLNPWIYSSSLPIYKIKWDYKEGKIVGELTQTQEGETFLNQIEVLLKYPNTSVLKTIKVYSKNQKFEFDSATSPLKIIINPHMNVLTGE
jgi:aminopeptidase N